MEEKREALVMRGRGGPTSLMSDAAVLNQDLNGTCGLY